LLDYHYWAQERVFDRVESVPLDQFTRDMGNSFPSIRDTLAHIHYAECVWYARWQEETLPMPSADMFPDVDSLRQVTRDHEKRMRSLLERLGQDGINTRLTYPSRLDGKTHTSVFWQMFQHLINHSTYHRGQVTTMLRQLGEEPPERTDLIQFYWDRGG
jgi:uncharacterized damage-inducible protein DinB